MLRTPSSLIAGTPTDVAADLSAGAAAHLRAEGVTVARGGRTVLSGVDVTVGAG